MTDEINLDDFKNSRARKEFYADKPESLLKSRIAYLEKQIAYVASLEAAKGLEAKTLAYGRGILINALEAMPKKPEEPGA